MAKGKYQEWLEPDNLILLAAWARDGLTDDQIAKKCGINRATLYVWKEKYPIINDALKKGKEITDVEVENALHKRTIGYTVSLKKTFKVKRVEYNENGYKCKEYEELVEGYDEVYVPPDTTAQIFWLKNRKPAEWRDKREVQDQEEAGTGETGVVELPAVNPQEEPPHE